MIKKGLFFLTIIFFIIFSCHLDGVFNGNFDFLVSVATFVKEGYSIPVFGNFEFGGEEISTVEGKKMFQAGYNYSAKIKVVNPEKLNLFYAFTSDSEQASYFFDNSPDNAILSSGGFSDSRKDLTLNFKLKKSADKKNLKIFFSIKNADTGRFYDAPILETLYFNRRPSPIIPKSDALGSPIKDNNRKPVVLDNKTTVYWDYRPDNETDGDVSHLKIIYKGATEIIKYDEATKKFGENSFTVETPSGENIDFALNVYDNENLDSGWISTGDFVPLRASNPLLIENEENGVLVSPPDNDSFVYYKVDSGEWLKTKDSVLVALTKTHTISAYSEKSGFFDSETITGEYSAKYTVKFNETSSSPKVKYGSLISSSSVPVPQKAGFKFAGWYCEEALETFADFSKPVISDIIFYAKWIENASSDSYVLTFNSNEGSYVNTQIVAKGTKAIEPTEPQKDGYSFGGWYKDSDLELFFDFSSEIVESDISLYAKWNSPDYFTVIFDCMGGSLIEPLTVKKGDKIIKPSTDPIKESASFEGWYKEKTYISLWNFDATLDSNVALYAKWSTTSSTTTTSIVTATTTTSTTIPQAVIVTIIKDFSYKTLIFTPSSSAVALGETVTISGSANFTDAIDWRWYENGIIITEETSSTFVFNSTGKLGDYIINCTVKSDGILYSGTIKITVKTN
ncbi:MAG TPA: InlB B-repeat-containing protein [Spirochaetota bacterium]|nr:InlB B-repeat-containing protein [Spirochaetota bacterium]